MARFAWGEGFSPFASIAARVKRSIAEAAQFTPGLWLLNRLSTVWLDAAATMRFAIHPPPDYVAVHTKFFDLIEARDGAAACSLMGDYFDRHDAQLSGALGALGAIA